MATAATSQKFRSYTFVSIRPVYHGVTVSERVRRPLAADNPALCPLCRFVGILDPWLGHPKVEESWESAPTPNVQAKGTAQKDQSFLDQHKARLGDVR